jgi:hypothetical protein
MTECENGYFNKRAKGDNESKNGGLGLLIKNTKEYHIVS